MNLKGALARAGGAEGRVRISAHRDPIRVGIGVVALGFVAAAALLRGSRLIAALGEARQNGRWAHNSARSSASRTFEVR